MHGVDHGLAVGPQLKWPIFKQKAEMVMDWWQASCSLSKVLNLGNGQPLGEETKELALTFHCFKLLDLPPLGDHRLLVSFPEMQAFIPRDPNILFNAMFLHKLPKSMFFWITLAD
jgi:hypothetical protein